MNKASSEAQSTQITRYNRHWAVWDSRGRLVVVAVYKKGAKEVMRRLNQKKKRRNGQPHAARARPEP